MEIGRYEIPGQAIAEKTVGLMGTRGYKAFFVKYTGRYKVTPAKIIIILVIITMAMTIRRKNHVISEIRVQTFREAPTNSGGSRER